MTEPVGNDSSVGGPSLPKGERVTPILRPNQSRDTQTRGSPQPRDSFLCTAHGQGAPFSSQGLPEPLFCKDSPEGSPPGDNGSSRACAARSRAVPPLLRHTLATPPLRSCRSLGAGTGAGPAQSRPAIGLPQDDTASRLVGESPEARPPRDFRFRLRGTRAAVRMIGDILLFGYGGGGARGGPGRPGAAGRGAAG